MGDELVQTHIKIATTNWNCSADVIHYLLKVTSKVELRYSTNSVPSYQMYAWCHSLEQYWTGYIIYFHDHSNPFVMSNEQDFENSWGAWMDKGGVVELVMSLILVNGCEM